MVKGWMNLSVFVTGSILTEGRTVTDKTEGEDFFSRCLVILITLQKTLAGILWPRVMVTRALN